MAQNPNLLIVIATYNEVNSLPRLVQQLTDQLPHQRILVIDDNSPDGTGRWCDQYAAKHSQLQVLHRPAKSGLGSATLLGLHWAIDHHYQFVATMDADLSHDANSLAEMFRQIQSQELGQIDVLIGSRYVAGGKIIGWPWYRRLSSRILNTYVRLVLGLETKDNSGALRIYRTSTLNQLELNRIRGTGYSYLEEILWRLQNTGARLVEFPIVFENRKQGKSKANFAEITNSLLQIIKLSFRRK